MATAGHRIGVAGATGALGTELLEMLSVSSIQVAELVPLATDRSLGNEVAFQGEQIPVETDAARLTGLDLIFLCAPPAASLEIVHAALGDRVPCIDLSGALTGSDDVPVRIAGYGSVSKDMPVIAIPAGPSLSWAMALQPLTSAGLKRVVGTVMESAAAVGRQGIEALYVESMALFSQTEPAESDAFARPVAFDCIPGLGDAGPDGGVPTEHRLVDDLSRLIGADVKVAATVVQIPVFVGQGSSLVVEFERDVALEEATERLVKAPGVEVWSGAASGPTTRNIAGRDKVVVGRIRRDRSALRSLQLWIAADPLRLAANHAIQIAALRL